MKTNKTFTIGIVGVRGYVGQELLKLIASHPLLKLDWVSSRQLQGQAISNLCDHFKSAKNLTVETLTPAEVANKHTDIVVLALPNGLAEPFVTAIEQTGKTQVLVDLSADYRFDKSWQYLVPEINNLVLDFNKLTPETNNQETTNNVHMIKISNPGCYATAMQLAIAPIKDLLAAKPNCFGISGYSGAGTTPNPNNNVAYLTDNIVAYKTVEHLHEKEVSHHLGLDISFTPHVAQFFRGINMTIQLEFSFPMTAEIIENRLNDFYAMHPLVDVQSNLPTLKQVVDSPFCLIGGIQLSADGKRATLISCLDNLLKGAASQAIQNINLALGQLPTLGLVKYSEQNPLIAKDDLLQMQTGAVQ